MRPPRETCSIHGLFSIGQNIFSGGQIGPRKQEDAAFQIVTSASSCRVSEQSGIGKRLGNSAVSSQEVDLPAAVPLGGSVRVQAEGSMRPSFCIFGLALARLIRSSAQAHSRGLAWFFAHSRPHEVCSGQHVVATFASGRRRRVVRHSIPTGTQTPSAATVTQHRIKPCSVSPVKKWIDPDQHTIAGK